MPWAAGHQIIPSSSMAHGDWLAWGSHSDYIVSLKKVVLAKQNGLILWLIGLHSMLLLSSAQGTFGFAGGMRVVLCSCSQAKMCSQSVFVGTNARLHRQRLSRWLSVGRQWKREWIRPKWGGCESMELWLSTYILKLDLNSEVLPPAGSPILGACFFLCKMGNYLIGLNVST